MTGLLRFDNVSCRFDGEEAVKEVSFSILPGEIVCLLGPSGCGKTTSLRLAAGMEQPSGGAVYLDDRLVSDAAHVEPPEKRGIGFLFQDFALFPHLSVYDNVVFGLRGSGAEESKKRAIELLNAVGLSGFANKYPNTLSGGEQQRVALARAMAPRPKLVLMDEPFSNLDPQLRDQMRDLTLRLLRENGAGGLVVTHDAADALRMADRIAVQHQGRILQLDTPETIYKSPVDLQVAAMFGPVNLAEDGEGRQIGVRPADLSLTGNAEDYCVTATVTDVRSIGAEFLCQLETETGADWQAVLRDGAPKSGETHKFFVPQACLMLFNPQSEGSISYGH